MSNATNDVPAPVRRIVGQTFRNSDMVSFLESADFRILLTQDPVLKACFDRGMSPLQTIIILADRAEAMRKKCEDLYRNGLPPVFVSLPNAEPSGPAGEQVRAQGVGGSAAADC
jgi:hypothetical protein